MTAGHPGLVLERIPYDPAAWGAIVDAHPDAEVYHSPGWLRFLAASQGAEPVIAIVREGNRPAGYFVGAIVRRYGIRILGSPLRGWATMNMGFLLQEGTDRRAAAEALIPFAFRDLGCLHVELADRRLQPEQMSGSGYVIERGLTFVVDLTGLESEVLGRMRRSTRKYISQASRKGLRADVATDESFADEFHQQLIEVFARQGLAPTYGVERVRHLIRALQPTGQLLLLRVLSPDGSNVASGISIGRNHTAVAWGAAFRREDSESHPNELLHWEAMRFWRAHGALRYDMSGRGDYKAKYGGLVVPTAIYHRSRYPLLRYGRAAVRRLFRVRQALAGRRLDHADRGAG